MKDIGSNDQVIRVGLKLLFARLAANVERAEIHLVCVLLKLFGRLLEESARDICERVAVE